MQLRINGQEYSVPESPDRSLLWLLRDELGLHGTRFGCGAGLCGACTVHLDGEAVRSCITQLSAIEGREIRTIEGLAGAEESRHPVQQAFIDHQVPQCGWCMSGQIMQAAALLESDPEIDEAGLIAGMERNLCRCGTYHRIKAALRDLAAAQGREASA